MRILLIGASGFIGNALLHAITSSCQQHEVITAGRRPLDGYEKWRRLDFEAEEGWDDSLLDDIQLLINAAGVIEGDLDSVHRIGPMRLYPKCVSLGVNVIHISALGAERSDLDLEFLRTKRATDKYLINYSNARVIYPAVVIGRNGKSSRFLSEIAQQPIVLVPKGVTLPTVHISQLADVVMEAIDRFESFPAKTFVVAKPDSLKTLFDSISKRKKWYLSIDVRFFVVLFRLFPDLSFGVFNRETFIMMKSIRSEDYPILSDRVSELLKPGELVASRVLPNHIALLAVSFIWVWSGVITLLSWELSVELINRVGLYGLLASGGVWLGAVLDILLGVLVFFRKYQRPVLVIQGLIILCYTLILTVFDSGHWMHPFGILAKNIPLLALTFYLYSYGGCSINDN